MQLKKLDYASPPNSEIWGDGEICSLICPPKPQDQVGATEISRRQRLTAAVSGETILMRRLYVKEARRIVPRSSALILFGSDIRLSAAAGYRDSQAYGKQTVTHHDINTRSLHVSWEY